MPMLPAYPDTLHVLVLDSISHDTSSFTQGLEMHNSLLYESTGRYGHSAIRILDPETGNLIDSANLPYFIFAEGITFLNETLYQLTWKAGIVFVFDETIHEQPNVHSIDTDGWGICAMDSILVTSDGSSLLRFRDPNDVLTYKTLMVTAAGILQEGLNELEYANGFIYANQWPTDNILKINPGTGCVESIIMTEGLLNTDVYPYCDVLNGIAWDSQKEVFLLTGKFWPYIYITEFVTE